MNITSATPEDVLRWFHQGEHKQQLLCILIARREDDQQKLAQMIQSWHLTDAALGEQVALVVFHPDAGGMLELPTAGGSPKFLGGVLNGSQISPLRKMEFFRGIRDRDIARHARFSMEAARNSARLNNDFMTLFGVEYEQLPAICTMVRSLPDVAVKSLGAEWSIDELHVYFGGLQKFLRDLGVLTDSACNLHRITKGLDSVVRNLESVRRKFNVALRGLGNKLDLSDQDKQLLNRCLERGDISQDGFEAFIQKIQSFNDIRAVRDGRLEKCRRLAGQHQRLIEQLRNQYRVGELQSVEDFQEEMRRMQLKLLAFVKATSSKSGSSSTEGILWLSPAIWSVIDRAKKLADLAKTSFEVAGGVLGLLR